VEDAVVGTANRHTNCHPVTFRHQVFEGVLQIGESSVKACQALAKALAWQGRRVWREMALVVGRKKCLCCRSIPLRPQRFEVPTHQRFVVFC
jgi:hypothetical protein